MSFSIEFSRPVQTGILDNLTNVSSLPTLETALEALRRHEDELRLMGVLHAAVFGSVARHQQTGGSDVDVLIELDANASIGVFEYARVKSFISQLFPGPCDIVNRPSLKPLLRESILRDSVAAF